MILLSRWFPCKVQEAFIPMHHGTTRVEYFYRQALEQVGDDKSKVDESQFSINKLWTQLIEKKKLFGFESKNKFIHITDINIYNQLLKND